MKGIMGKILWVNLSTGAIHEETPDQKLYEDYLGGYGIGVRYIYDRMPAGVDPLGPDNILAFMTGPLTGTNAITGNRWTVMGKSPKTMTWGDANCGGTFGPALKAAGYDGVFVTGAAQNPVYILIDDGKAEILDASAVWDQGEALHPETFLREKHGKQFEVAWVGESGEKMSLTAGVMNDIGRAAARSGLGAVMGAKKLKAIVAGGKQKVPVADQAGIAKWVGDILKSLKQGSSPMYQAFGQFGTSSGAGPAAIKGDSPVKNWAGVGSRDFPDAFNLSDLTELKSYEVKRAGCWHCAIACSADQKVADGPYASETHRPEYETMAAFGTMTLTGNLAAMHKANELTNFYGMDTITVGSTISFAMECYEKGLITKEDTGGLELTWGNTDAMIKMIELIGKREGIGELFADGVAKAAERIGKGSEEFAIHIHGEEVAMHDPRFAPGLATTYQVDATPARHTQGGTGEMEFVGLPIPEALGAPGKHEYGKKGLAHRVTVNHRHITNTAGVCIFAGLMIPHDGVEAQLSFVTGDPWDARRVQIVGERIATLRHAFNLREGLNPVEFKVPSRILDGRPLGEGPNKDIVVDLEAARRSYFELVGWDQETALPSEQSLRALGLDELVKDLHPATA